jgi:hypothetical protein
MDAGTPERYFYHSFPRRGASTNAEIDKGCAILTAIRDFGLVLTPQLNEWKQPSLGGAPRTFPVLQKRVNRILMFSIQRQLTCQHSLI